MPSSTINQEVKIDGQLDEKLINPFISTITNVVEESIGINVDKGKLFHLPISFTTMAVAALIKFQKEKKGIIIIDMLPATAIFIASKMMREECKKVNRLVKSAITELANIIAGRAAPVLSKFGNLQLSLPELVMSNSLSFNSTDQKIYIFPLGFEKRIMNVNFLFSSVKVEFF